MIQSPVPHRGDHPVGVGAGLTKAVPTLNISRTVGLAEDQLHDLEPHLADGRGGCGELSFVQIVHLHRLAQDGHGFGAGHPIEILIDDEAVVSFQSGEVMTVGVAMALRIGLGRIQCIQHAIVVEILDVVVLNVDDLARIDATGEVPVHAVVGGGRLHARLHEIIPTAEQGQFLFQQGADLTGEAELRRGHATVGGFASSDRDGRIGGVRVSLIPHQGVEIVQIAGHEQQGIIGGAIVDPGIDAQIASPAEDRLVDLDQSGAVDVVETQCDGPFPTATRLRQHADIGVDRIVVQVGHALLEGIDPGQHPLDPTLGQLRLRPSRPLTDLRIGRVGRAISHDEVVVRQHAHAGATQGVARHGRAVLQGQPLRHGGVHRRRSAVDRSGDTPIVFILAESARQVGSMLQGEQFIERIG